jgi:hypothetical protein
VIVIEDLPLAQIDRRAAACPIGLGWRKSRSMR